MTLLEEGARLRGHSVQSPGHWEVLRKHRNHRQLGAVGRSEVNTTMASGILRNCPPRPLRRPAPHDTSRRQRADHGPTSPIYLSALQRHPEASFSILGTSQTEAAGGFPPAAGKRPNNCAFVYMALPNLDCLSTK